MSGNYVIFVYLIDAMKKSNYLIVPLIVLLASCVGSVPNSPYVYNTNPSYRWGYAEFFGNYYPNIPNTNVISLSLFSDSLKINSIGNLTGTGQYLFLEDIFVSKKDTFLPTGTYYIRNSSLPNSVAPGIKDTVDNQVFLIGATISYFEGNPDMSVQKLITDGYFTVSKSAEKYLIFFYLKTSDKKDLKGSFTAAIPHIDQSLNTPKSSPRKRLVYLAK